MEKQLIDDFRGIGSLYVALVTVVAAIVSEKVWCKQELRVMAWLCVIMDGYIGADQE